MNEIVRRLREGSKGKLFFESESIDIEDAIVETDDTIVEESLESVDDPTIVEEEVNVETINPCTCGSTNMVQENGKLICDHCGRVQDTQDDKIVESTFTKNDEARKYKIAALKKSLEWWNAGHYQKAVELYKKYGVTDSEFARYLVRSLRESEDVEDSVGETDLLAPIVDEREEETGNIIRSVQKPMSTAQKPNIDSAIAEALKR